MTMGDKIRELRKENHLTQEELGQKLSPTVNRSGINKWEKGRVENIKRTHIEQMAKIFGVQPSDLMCFREQDLAEDVKLIEQIQGRFGSSAVRLLEYYVRLNTLGKNKAVEQIDDLTNIQKYIDKGDDGVQG